MVGVVNGVRITLMDATRLAQTLRMLEEQRGDLLFDMSHAKIGLARMEAELLRIEDAISELKTERERLSDEVTD